MFLKSSKDFEKIKNQTYGEIFRERGLKACLINAGIICLVFFTSDEKGSSLGYGLLFLVSTLADVMLPKMIATYKNKFANKKK